MICYDCVHECMYVCMHARVCVCVCVCALVFDIAGIVNEADHSIAELTYGDAPVAMTDLQELVDRVVHQRALVTLSINEPQSRMDGKSTILISFSLQICKRTSI